MTDIPEPWASALIAARLVDPRYADDRPSLGRLAEAARIHTTTVSRMIRGTHRADPENVARVAEALGRDVVTVSSWVDQARSVSTPYKVPSEVNLLTDREQAALTDLIRAMAAAREAGDRGGDTPATTPAGDDPAGQFDGARAPIPTPDIVIFPAEGGSRAGSQAPGRRAAKRPRS